VYTSDLVIGDSLQVHGEFGVGYVGSSSEVWTFPTYELAKSFAVIKAKEDDRVSVYLWGHDNLEPDLPRLVNHPGYKQLA
jgi:hypothetical protein